MTDKPMLFKAPMVEVSADLDWLAVTDKFRAALEARGLEIKEKEQ